jgi:hypothetical protein
MRTTTLLIALTSALALAACDKGGDASTDQPAKSDAKAADSAKTSDKGASADKDKAGEEAEKEAPKEVLPPKLGNLDSVDYETVKKLFTDAGWKVSGSATKSSMYAMTLNCEKDGVKFKLQYYKNGGDSWEKRLEKDKATVHKAGDVLVGVIVEEGDADPKKILDALVG